MLSTDDLEDVTAHDNLYAGWDESDICDFSAWMRKCEMYMVYWDEAFGRRTPFRNLFARSNNRESFDLLTDVADAKFAHLTAVVEDKVMFEGLFELATELN
ncbi:MAG: hypothetical protein JSS82_03460 [Bacteroidetes bacterium]|nr:hypothetical protein [Bacteroidota bacterium]